MNLTFIKPKKGNGKLKLTVQKTGKLGFSMECNKTFNFDKNGFVKFAN